jgi:hypothetical protein
MANRFNEPSKSLSELSPKDNYLNGVFYFSNNADEDFHAWWNSVRYTFPAHTASPMIIAAEPPEGVQNIRKRFAQKWAEEQLSGSKAMAMLEKGGGKLATLYPPVSPYYSALEPLIQSCLEPLPIEQASVKSETPIERTLEKGRVKPTIKASRPVNSGEKATKIIDAEDPTPQEVGKL